MKISKLHQCQWNHPWKSNILVTQVHTGVCFTENPTEGNIKTLRTCTGPHLQILQFDYDKIMQSPYQLGCQIMHETWWYSQHVFKLKPIEILRGVWTMVNYPPGAILYRGYHVHSGLVFLKKWIKYLMQTNNTHLHQYSLILMSM